MMDDRLFRDTMGRFATGITIVTINDNGDTKGMTVNAFMSVSLQPKLIAISIDDNASMFDLLAKSTQFGVSVLKEEQKEVSMFFARQKVESEMISYHELDGVPVLDNALANLSCKVKEKVRAGDHLIYIAEVTDLVLNDGEPIVFFGGKYRKLND